MKEKKAFTLAETMIVLVVLGVIAMVTVPALVNKHIESANRTKVKKAMSVYDTALNKMVIENGIKDNAALYENANSFAPENDCTNTAPYFKVSTVLNNNICTFKAPDGLFWDISKINAPIIAFSEADLNNANAENRYQLVGHFDNNGSLRVDDLAFERGGVNEAALTKVYNYVNNTKLPTQTISASKFASCTSTAATCTVDNIEYTKIEIKNDYIYDGEYCSSYDNCDAVKNTLSTKGVYYVTLSDSNITGKDAQTVCKDGTRLPTVAELRNMYNANLLNCDSGFCSFWTSDVVDNEVYLMSSDGIVSLHGNNYVPYGNQSKAICIGN